ncbi:hypothetical protein ABPG72_009476 [Tetrahymena utriculariae]
MIGEQSDKQQQPLQQFQLDLQESSKVYNQENVELKYNQSNIDFVKRILKSNRLLEGKKKSSKQTQLNRIYTCQFINEKIDINHKFDIFGNVEIPNNFDYLEIYQPICSKSIYQKITNKIQIIFDKTLDQFDFSSINISHGINQFEFL